MRCDHMIIGEDLTYRQCSNEAVVEETGYDGWDRQVTKHYCEQHRRQSDADKRIIGSV